MLLEVYEEYIDICDDFEKKNNKVDAYVEATLRELDINCDEADLKVVNESGTEDDLAYLYQEAEEGAMAKIKRAIEAAIRAFVEFIKNLKTKIIRMVTNAETKLVLSKVGKKIKLNPFLARKKVKVIDKKKPLAIIAKYKSKTDSRIAKVAAGVFRQKDITSIASDREAFDTEYRNVVAGAAALVTTTVAKLMTSIEQEVQQLPKHVDSIDKETSKVVEKLVKGLDKEEAAAVRGAFTACANFRTKLGEREASEHVDSVMYKLKTLKSEVMKYKSPKDLKENKKGKKTKARVARESVEDDDIFADLLDGFEESAEDDYDPFDDLDDDDFMESAFDDDTYDYTADDLLADMQDLLGD